MTLTASVNGEVLRRLDTGYNISVSAKSLQNYVRVLKNDFILHLSSFRSGLAFSDYEGITSPAYLVLRVFSKNNHLPTYWKYYFRTEGFIESLIPFTYGLRVGKTINLYELNESILAYPTLNEQTKIASLFDNLNSLITLHQRKLDKLKNIKNQLLERMFADEKNPKPAIRFKQFTNDWEQKKFEDIFFNIKEKNNGTFDIKKYISVATNTFKTDLKINNVKTIAGYSIFRVGDIAYEGHTNKEFPFGRFVQNTLKNGIISNIFTVFRPKIGFSLNFSKYWANNNNVMLTALKRSSKSGIMMNSLDIEIMNKEIIKLPDFEEQKRVGWLFSDLDTLITLHQCNNFLLFLV
ncbi:restriction endonuclease subunit S [Metamycoplasma canadense]|uniref:restriction endonuclease subunit S n=1 Tax=Metamycoplasma canadense TaxID=29554 RepID=UPI000693FFB2|nr:restriction endonuclease subunit S [Metamycoplasma canadense]